MQTFSLTSWGVKILVVFVTVWCIGLTILTIIYRNTIGIFVLWTIVALLLFGNFVIFNHRIFLNEKKIIVKLCGIKGVKNISVDINDIKTIKVIGQFLGRTRFATIAVITNSDITYKLTGYISIVTDEDIEKTKSIVDKINEYIKQNANRG